MADPWAGPVEVEDLPAQRVVARGSAGPGLRGTAAVVAAVLLLAAGFGLLGGRKDTTSTAVVDRTPGAPTAAAAFTGEPLVTPARRCGSTPAGPPGVLLDLSGRSTLGAVEVLDGEGAASSVPGNVEGVPAQTLPPRLDVRSDIAPEIWTAGRACAVAWTIELLGRPASDVLAFVANPGRDPELASQNWFPLVLAGYAGRSIDLSATLVFPSFTLRALWPIRVLPFSPPVGVFSAAGAGIQTLEGCRNQLMLGNGWVTETNFCLSDVVEKPAEPTPIAPGRKLEFRFDPAGWQIGDITIACGHFPVTVFAFDPTCRIPETMENDDFSFSVTVHDLPGEVALALSTCGTQVLVDATNQLCGTWYVDLNVTGEAAP